MAYVIILQENQNTKSLRESQTLHLRFIFQNVKMTRWNEEACNLPIKKIDW